MAIFRQLYNKVINWSKHRHAPYYLAGVSFIESSVFPIPPDVMLIPMVMGKPEKAWRYATITTMASILGGILGYFLGLCAFELIGEPLLQSFGYQQAYAKVVTWFEHYGFLAVFVAGFTPIPYKLFTIAAGATMMPLLPFVIASVLGRTIRFFVVVWGIKGIGKRLEPLFVEYIDTIVWFTIGLIGLAIVIYYCFA
ncbi:MAG: DedA family protein [Proteobacteria bacterium]|nr:DedA family protein [Pseudomonadota bacterium]